MKKGKLFVFIVVFATFFHVSIFQAEATNTVNENEAEETTIVKEEESETADSEDEGELKARKEDDTDEEGTDEDVNEEELEGNESISTENEENETETVHENNEENDIQSEEVTSDDEEVENSTFSVKTMSSEEKSELKLGDSGDQVTQLQQNLKALGFMVGKNINGKFDAATEEEVRLFQSYFGLKINGVANEETLNKVEQILHSPLRNGQRHDDTIDLKVNLSELGFHISDNPTTLYGSSTEKKVKEFQQYYGLRVNGIADEVTLGKIAAILSSHFRNGVRHEDTILLKENLSYLGFHVSDNPTSLYGSETANKVREFQSSNGLIVNGIADEVTLAKIQELLNSPMQNGLYRNDVITLKVHLSEIGFHISDNPTPWFGPTTEKVVKEFQSYYGLKVTGIVGEETLDKINEILASPFRTGKYHNDTINLKEDLSRVGFHISNNPTTFYGASTEAKVKEFQKYYGLKVNGIADEITLKKLQQIVSSPFQTGQSHDNTIELKVNLSKLGFHISDNPTRLYGSQTEKAVREFQKYYGLTINGIADEITFAKIQQVLTSPLQNGIRHANTIKLKEDLSKLGFHVSNNPTDFYGDTTEANVRAFQEYYSLRNNGIADQVTLAKIREILSSPFQNGKSYSGTIKLKEDLAKVGYPVSSNPTTFYGSSTEKAVRQFQGDNKLRVNGIADEVTLAKIKELVSSKLVINYTQYNLTLNEAINKQLQLNPPPQTDLYRNTPAYIHSSLVDIVERGTLTDNGINIRTSQYLRSDNIYGTYNKGTTFTIDGIVTGDTVSGSTKWYKITYNNNTLYVHTSLATKTQAAIVKSTSNIRESASTSSHIYGSASANRELVILKEVTGTSVSGSTKWYEINFDVWRNAKTADFRNYLDPEKNDRMQHLELDKSVGVSASQLNNILAGKGILQGMGQAFIDAGRTHSVNEIYLISHALLETGNGTSKLARGIDVGKDSNGKLVLVTDSNRSNLTAIKTTYNMFGTGAGDSDPYYLGATYAYKAGWFTPEAAIIGGAAFVSESYFARGQNTLYKMRWNHLYRNSYGGYPQYATDMGWAVKQLSSIKSLYEMLDNPTLRFDIVKYK